MSSWDLLGAPGSSWGLLGAHGNSWGLLGAHGKAPLSSGEPRGASGSSRSSRELLGALGNSSKLIRALGAHESCWELMGALLLWHPGSSREPLGALRISGEPMAAPNASWELNLRKPSRQHQTNWRRPVSITSQQSPVNNHHWTGSGGRRPKALKYYW